MSARSFPPIPAPVMQRTTQYSLFRRGDEYTVVGPGWTFTSADHAHAAAHLVARVDAVREHCERFPDDAVARAVLALLRGEAPA